MFAVMGADAAIKEKSASNIPAPLSDSNRGSRPQWVASSIAMEFRAWPFASVNHIRRFNLASSVKKSAW